MPVRTADPAARADPAPPADNAPPIAARGRGRLGRYAPSLALLAITGAVCLRDPHRQGAWGLCPTHQLLGVSCPGCGSLRALHDLATGRWAEAVAHNALVVPAFVFVGFAAWRTPGRWWSWIWLVTITVFTIARNVPGSPLAP